MIPERRQAIIWRKPGAAEMSEKPFVDALRQRLRGRVEQVFVFGSFGTPDFHSGSDVDLILVKDAHLPFWERAREFEDLYDLHPRLDLLVYRQDELEALLTEPTGF